MKQVIIHDQAYSYLSWQELGEHLFELAKKILQKEDHDFDRVIALARGGLTYGRSIVDFLNIPELSSIQVEFYSGIKATKGAPVITQSLPISIRNEKILVLDDIVDTGESMKVAVEYLKYHGVKSITTATLLEKPWSIFTVDYSVFSTDAWVIFPNECRESVIELWKKWRKMGDSEAQIVQNFLKIGLPKAEVEFFRPDEYNTGSE